MGSPTTSPSSNRENYADSSILHELGNLGCDRIDDLFEQLGVSLRRSGGRWAGACPVHGGRSPFAFSFYPDGEVVRGFWKCRTDHCEQSFPKSLVGLIRGVLSQQQHGWQRKEDPEVGHRAAVDWLCEFLGVSLADIKVDPDAEGRRAFRRGVRALTGQRRSTQEILCTREKLHRMLKIPAPYFVGRGYLGQTLENFEVGEVVDRRSPSFGRVLIPIYDDDHDDPIGAITRSVHEKCPDCRLCHEGPCPAISEERERLKYLRYGTVGRFNEKNHLYNIGRARGVAREHRCVVLVEGASDVWRLEEAGVKNAVAIFGSEMTTPQQQLLAELMPRHVIILTDNDEAGLKAAEAIEARCVFANTARVLPHGKDVGSMTVEEVRRRIVPQIESKMKR